MQLPRPQFLGIDFNEERPYYWLCLGVVARDRLDRVPHPPHLDGSGDDRRARERALGGEHGPIAATGEAVGVRHVRRDRLAGRIPLRGAADQLLQQPRVDGSGRGESLSLVVTAVFGGIASVTGAVLGSLWIVGIPRLLGRDYALFSSGFAVVADPADAAGRTRHGGVPAARSCGRLAAPRPADRRRRRTPSNRGDRRSDRRRADEPARPERWRRASTASIGPAPIEAIRHQRALRRADGARLRVDHRPQGRDPRADGPERRRQDDAVRRARRQHPGRRRPRRTYGGRDITDLPPHRRARIGLGRTYQQARLFGELTTAESVAISLAASPRLVRAATSARCR